jgi:hypothetical protein
MPWRKRGRTIPASCADLDLEAVADALIRTGGAVCAAARALGVPTRDLRQLVYARPELLDAALEAEERAIDEAEAALREATRTGPLSRRIVAAGFFLRAPAAGRRRGFGHGAVRQNAASDAAPIQTVSLRWRDS